MYPGRIKSLLLLTALLASLGYFAYHGLYGQRGFFTHGELRVEHAALLAERDVLRERRVRWEKRVSGLSGDVLDADLLDEEVRRLFRYAEADEILVSEDMIR